MQGRIYILLIITLFNSTTLLSQDTTALLQEVKQLVQTGKKTNQQLLTDSRYLAIHPQTEFRELIKGKASGNEITYVTGAEPGKKITVIATVKDEQGKPAADALVYCYQTDTKGWYGSEAPHFTGMEGDRRHARLFAYLRTDNNGRFTLHTIEPNGYPQSTLPGHIHIEIFAGGYNAIITEFLFDDDPRLNTEARKRGEQEGFIIAKAVDNTYTYSLTLHKQ